MLQCGSPLYTRKRTFRDHNKTPNLDAHIQISRKTWVETGSNFRIWKFESF